MMRRPWILALAALVGCTCKKSSGTDPVGSAAPSASVSAEAPVPTVRIMGPFRHSLPIAATVTRDGAVVAGALAVKDKTVDVLRFDKGEPRVSAAMTMAAWKSDAELRFFGHDGAAAVLVFRGELDGHTGRFAQWLDAPVARKPTTIGAGACLAGPALYWVDAQGHVRSQASEGDGKTLRPPAVDDPQWSVVCGAVDTWLAADGDEGLAVMKITGAKAHGRLEPAFAASDLDPDNTREVHALVDGDHVAFVGLGSAGKLLWRPKRDAASRTLRSSLGDGDDVVALDARSGQLLVVFTREASAEGVEQDTCQEVRAVVASKEGDGMVQLAAGGCGRARGPFFVSALGPERRMVSWIEHRSNKGLGLPSVAGLGYAVVGPDVGLDAGLVPSRFLPFEADGLVDAGCFGGRCAAVGLVRPPGATDDSQAGAVEVRWYP